MTQKIYLISLLVALLLGAAFEAASQEILVVQNHKIKPYRDAFSGFKSELNSKFRGNDYTFRDSNGALEYLRETKPDLVLVIGVDALKRVKVFPGVPIVYLMVLNPSAVVHDERNVTGVSMTISPDKQLAAIHKVLPAVRRIGLVYDPKKSASFVKRAQSASKEFKIDLLVKEVSDSKLVPATLNTLKGVVDAFWMIPDTTVITPATIELIMLFSLENHLPVCTFSTKYLDMGAFMSLDINAFEMGRQAGELATKILLGKRVSELPPVEADTASLAINESVARKLQIPLDENLRGKALFLR